MAIACAAQPPRGQQRVVEGARAARRAGAIDIRLAVGQQHDERRLPFAPDAFGERRRRVEALRNRRAAAAGHRREKPLRARQRARRRQHDVGLLAAKSDERHAVAAHIAIGQHQFDRALDLRESLHGGGAGCVDDENRRRPAALTKARDAEVIGAHMNRKRWRFRRLDASQFLPRRRGP